MARTSCVEGVDLRERKETLYLSLRSSVRCDQAFLFVLRGSNSVCESKAIDLLQQQTSPSSPLLAPRPLPLPLLRRSSNTPNHPTLRPNLLTHIVQRALHPFAD